MRMNFTRLAAAVLMLFVAAPAICAERDHVGLTMGFPTSIGVILPVTNWLSVRPDLSIARISGGPSSVETLVFFGVVDPNAPSTTNTSASPTTSWHTTVGVSGVLYVGGWDDLRTYLSPRFGYSRWSSTTSSISETADFESSSYMTSGSFGARYALGRHFGVFGEAGFTYTTMTNTSRFSVPSPLRGSLTSVGSVEHTHEVGSRSGVGVIVYF